MLFAGTFRFSLSRLFYLLMRSFSRPHRYVGANDCTVLADLSTDRYAVLLGTGRILSRLTHLFSALCWRGCRSYRSLNYRYHHSESARDFSFGLIATDPIYDPSITPFKKPSKITPQAMPSTILESEVFGPAERYDVPRSSEPSDLPRRFKVVDAALDDLIQILCRYLFSNG